LKNETSHPLNYIVFILAPLPADCQMKK